MSNSIREYLGRRYDTGDVVRVCVCGGKIASVEAIDAHTAEKAPYIAPGLFDLQVNGAVGVEFSSSKLTVDGVLKTLEKMLRDGVFRCCPTLTTNAPEVMIEAARTIANALKSRPELQPVVWGIHLEGPFISTAEGAIGAHPKRFCTPYSKGLFEAIQSACGGLVKIVTLSPEYPNVGEFVRYLYAQGVKVAIGHTNANAAQIVEATRAGATLSTHLSNATRHLLPKWENYFFAQLANDELYASLIVDGFHISPELIRIITRAKGLERVILISDQSPLAGYPPGKYSMELCDFEIQPNGKVTLAGDPNLLACASFPVSNGVANLMAIENLTLAQVYPLASTAPATFLGAPRFSNGDGDFLEIGADADFIIFDLEPAQLGVLGILDGGAFKTGRFELANVLWRGREIV